MGKGGTEQQKTKGEKHLKFAVEWGPLPDEGVSRYRQLCRGPLTTVANLRCWAALFSKTREFVFSVLCNAYSDTQFTSGNARMGSMCCKRFESPHVSPKLPDFNRLFVSCAEQIQLCRKNIWDEEDTEPKQRKFSVSDISYPLPLGCVILPPQRPPRKRKTLLERTTSERVKNGRHRIAQLKRSKSIHEIFVVSPHLASNGQTTPKEIEARVGHSSSDLPNSDEIVLNVIKAVGGADVPLDSLTLEEKLDDDDYDTVEPPEQVLFQRSYYSDYSSPNLPPLEPIIESAYESLESTSSSSLVAENKRHFLAALLEENNNTKNSNHNLPSRKSSITESLREFECSLYDMLEQESAKDEVDEIKWMPQIPVFSYH